MTQENEFQNRLKTALTTMQKMRAKIERLENAQHEPIAIIGIGCRFPGADGPDALWQLLLDGVDAIQEIPQSRWNVDEYFDPDPDAPGKMITRWGGFLEGIDQFDATFFGVSPREARSIDPQQRLLMETSWSALEHAGVAPSSLTGSNTGVFMGVSLNDYLLQQTKTQNPDNIDAYRITGNYLHNHAGRLSYFLGINGPSITVDTACSSSLTALHLAVNSLRNNESTMALSGGVNLIFSPEVHISATKANMMAADGRCKTFDARADGFVRSEGVGVVVLKRLSDAQRDGDRILATIRGTAVNQDGASSGLTVPNKLAQEEVIRQALANAKVAPADISYVEAHGTGTPLGDPIEVRALSAVLGEGREKPFYLGSLKANIGHPESAAGIAGLIKVALCLYHGKIPPNLHFETPTPNIDWEQVPAIVPTSITPWEGPNRIAGLSSYGASGSNAHALVSSAPIEEESESVASELPHHIFTLSGQNQDALNQQIENYNQYLETTSELSLANVCHTVNGGREHFRHRVAVVADTIPDLKKKLASFKNGQITQGCAQGVVNTHDQPRVAFLFTGQGAQYAGMGRDLYETEPVFREALDACDAILTPLLERPFLRILFGEEDENLINQTAYTQPGLFALEYALAQLWLSWGVKPNILLGHSVGEFVAACIAGVFDLEAGLRLITARGRLMQALPAGGAMAAVFAPEETVAAAIEPYLDQVSIAAKNGPTSIVISGAETAVTTILNALANDDIKSQSLNVSHAFHSPLMAPMMSEFKEVSEQIEYHQPQIPLIANVIGKVFTPDYPPNAAYWQKHVMAPVRFAEGMQTLDETAIELFLEVGPSPTLLGMGRRCLPDSTSQWLPSLRKERDDWQQLLESLGKLYTAGYKLDWHAFTQRDGGQKITLPTYPFQHRQYWFEASPFSAQSFRQNGEVLHPLLHHKIPTAVRATIFESYLTENTTNFLEDHRIAGEAILPATAYIELALTAASKLFNEEVTVITDMLIQKALVLTSDETQQVQVILTQTGAREADFLISSQALEGGEWQTHAEGRLQTGTREVQIEEDQSLDAFRQHSPDEIAGTVHYEDMQERGMGFGPAFQGVSKIWAKDNEAWGEIVQPEMIAKDANRYQLHPALLDAGLQVLSGVLPDDGNTYIPVGIGSLHVYSSLPEHFYSSVTIHPTDNAKLIKVSVKLLDENNHLLVDFSDLTLQQIDSSSIQFSSKRAQTDWKVQVEWQQQPSPEAAKSAQESASWLLISHENALEHPLIKEIQGAGDMVQCITTDTLQSSAAWTEIWDEPQSPQGIIYFAGDGFPQAAVQDAAAITDIQKQIVEPLLGIMPHITQLEVPPRLWLITRGAQAIAEEEPVAIAQRPLWGLAQSLNHEHPELRCTCIDLSAYPQVGEQEILWAEIQGNSEERQITLHNHERFAARLRSYKPDTKIVEPVHLTMETRGQLTDLHFQPSPRRQLKSGEVELRVLATGMNFRDVLKALDMYPDPEIIFGDECSGVVTAVSPDVTRFKVGDAVLGRAPDCYSTYAITQADFLVPKPPQLSFVDAATIPIAFITAHYALFRRGNLQPGERILIHAAAGGVGQAAVQLALKTGAEIWGTAGSPEKRAFLRQMGVHHVLNSRTLDFADEIIKQTNGEGVDVILNSLNQDFIERNLAAMSDNGRFLEMGKIGIWDEDQIHEVRPNAQYHIIFPEYLFVEQPDVIQAMLQEVTTEISEGIMQPLPRQVFPLDRVQDAFRFMAQARHVGKIVVTQKGDPTNSVQEKIRPDGAYLITGGFSGIGLLTARWLAEQGAKHLVLAGRRGATEEAAPAIAELANEGVTVTSLAADISKESDVSRVLQSIAEIGVPLRGIIHSAGVNADNVLLQQEWSNFERVFSTKLDGTWHLHAQTMSLDLDFFVLFSSVASLLGSAGQTNYSAANAFMDGFAQYRHTLGLPAVSINWGAWDKIGMTAVLSDKDLQRLKRQGLDVIPAQEGMKQLGQMPTTGQAQVGILPLNLKLYNTDSPFFSDMVEKSSPMAQEKKETVQSSDLLPKLNAATPNKRHTIMLEFVENEARLVLGLDESYALDDHAALIDIGLDSLMAVELRNRLNSNLTLKRPLPATLIFDYPTTSAISGFLLKNVPLDDEADGSDEALDEKPEPSLLDNLDALESLSDDDVEKLFSEMGLAESTDNE